MTNTELHTDAFKVSKNCNLWKASLKTGGAITTDGSLYAIQNDIVGIGWGVLGNPTTAEEYLQTAESIYPKDMINITNFVSHAKQNDIIIARHNSKYYIGSIQGDWYYEQDDKKGFHNQRRCRWVHIEYPNDMIKSKTKLRNAFHNIAKDKTAIFEFLNQDGFIEFE